jgi:hypothetical protein
MEPRVRPSVISFSDEEEVGVGNVDSQYFKEYNEDEEEEEYEEESTSSDDDNYHQMDKSELRVQIFHIVPVLPAPEPAPATLTAPEKVKSRDRLEDDNTGKQEWLGFFATVAKFTVGCVMGGVVTILRLRWMAE